MAWIEPVFTILFFISLGSYLMYLAWWRPEYWREQLLNYQKRLPTEYPFRSYAIRQLESPYWVLKVRAFSIVAAVFSILGMVSSANRIWHLLHP